MSRRVLIAGIGNIFLQDDGFGVEVARRLGAEALPESVRLEDFGVRGIHLAYELLEQKYDLTVLVDAIARGGDPGTLFLIEPNLDDVATSADVSADAHSMTPQNVFKLLRSLGGKPKKILIVGCEPLETDEGMGLSEPVAHAVEEAIKFILEIVEREVGVKFAAGKLPIEGG